MNEILFDGHNYVDETGDVRSIDHPVWEQQAFIFDHLGSEEVAHDEVEPLVEPGISVKLSDRAIAIQGIMAYFNQVNKGVGLAKSRGYNNFDARYGRDANKVASGMDGKEQALYTGFKRSLGVLAARSAQLEQGVEPAVVAAEERLLSRDLYRQYGPGNAKHADRAKLIRKTSATARKVAKATSSQDKK